MSQQASLGERSHWKRPWEKEGGQRKPLFSAGENSEIKFEKAEEKRIEGNKTFTHFFAPL